MHKILVRQVKHHIGESVSLSSSWQELLDAISTTYEDFDKDRALIERSLNISSTELKDLISLLQATLNSTHDGILVVDAGHTILQYNKRLLEILEISEDILATHDTEQLMAEILKKAKNPEQIALQTSAIMHSPEQDSSDIIFFTDGKIIERYSKPQMAEGKSPGRVWSYRDVTKRVTAENRLKTEIIALEKLNKVMIDRELKMVELKTKIKMLEVQLDTQKDEHAPHQ